MAKNSYPLNYVSSQLDSILSEMFTEYSEELYEKANIVTEQIAKDFAVKLKDVTPRSDYTGEHIADTIKVSEETKKSFGRSGKVYRVHFGKWQIAHLLEFGWTAKNGKRITRRPFVRTLFDNNKERYVNMYKEALKK